MDFLGRHLTEVGRLAAEYEVDVRSLTRSEHRSLVITRLTDRTHKEGHSPIHSRSSSFAVARIY